MRRRRFLTIDLARNVEHHDQSRCVWCAVQTLERFVQAYAEHACCRWLRDTHQAVKPAIELVNRELCAIKVAVVRLRSPRDDVVMRLIGAVCALLNGHIERSSVLHALSVDTFKELWRCFQRVVVVLSRRACLRCSLASACSGVRL